MTDLQIYEVRSRRLKRVTPIPWAEPAALTAQGYPSFLRPVQHRNEGLKRKVQTVRHDQWTPSPFYLAGNYPATVQLKSNHVAFKQRHPQPPKLDQYTETPTGYYSGYYPGSKRVDANRHKNKISLRKPLELNQYTETPAGYYSGFYPGSKRVEPNKFKSRRDRQELPQHDQWVQATSDAPLTAFLERPYTIRHKPRSKRDLPEHNEYPQIQLSAAVLPALYKVTPFYNKGLKRTLITPTLSKYFDAVVTHEFTMYPIVERRVIMPSIHTKDMTPRVNSRTMLPRKK